jgi:exopolysaccharide biosynthesis polyprenyl glycosylphosphotransferase
MQCRFPEVWGTLPGNHRSESFPIVVGAIGCPAAHATGNPNAHTFLHVELFSTFNPSDVFCRMSSDMSLVRRTVLMEFLKLFDIVLFLSAFFLSAASMLKINEHLPFSEFLSSRIRIRNFVLVCALALMWHLLFGLFGLYRSRRLSTTRSICVDLLKATSAATIGLVAFVLVFRLQGIDWVFLISFWVYSSTLAIFSRLALCRVLAIIRCRSRNLRHLLIVGTNSRAIECVKHIDSRPDLGYRIIGFADDFWTGSCDVDTTGHKRVCGLSDFAKFLASSVVDEVIIALPVASSYDRARRVAKICEEQGVMVRFLPTLFDFSRMRLLADMLEEVELITYSSGAPDGLPAAIKRILDVAVALGLIILVAPVLLVTAIIVKMTSPGSVLFVQKRVGFNKRVFSMYKFRTMVADAENKMAEVAALNEVSGPVFKIKNDPRMTKVGKFLRRTSIDELPQLFNVIKGDMSLVGPRPLPIRDYEGFSKDWQRRRFSVHPGITCLWQIKGRSSITFDEWMELDMQYIDKWSLQLDLTILARTIPAVLKGSGAV